MCFSVCLFFLFTSAEEYNLFIPLPYRQDEEKIAVFNFFDGFGNRLAVRIV